jgi:hypothetical protein
MRLYTGLAVIALSLSISLSASGQIKPVEQFLEQNPDLQKYFIYQSTLRMLNQSGNADFNKLIKDIRKINVYVANEGSAGVSRESYQKMVRDLSSDKFETLVSAKMQGALVNLMSKDSGSAAYYVLAVTQGTDFMLLEMDGALDLRYLESLDNISLSQLNELLGLDDKEQTIEKEEHDDEGN